MLSLIFFLPILIMNSAISHAMQGVSIHIEGALCPEAAAIFECLEQPIDLLEQANMFAQKNLLRVGERWDEQLATPIQQTMQLKKDELIQHLHKLGMIEEIKPDQKEFVYALLCGSLKDNVCQRMDWLADLFNDGYTFEYIAVLGGQRPLRDIEKVGLDQTITVEIEMMKHVLSQHPILKDKSVVYVDAPMLVAEDGSLKRPITDDTLRHFMSVAPKNGNCLVISNNPYVMRQEKVAQRVLDQELFPTQGTGRVAVDDRYSIVIVMDEFARLLYEEYQQFVNSR